MSRTRQAPGKPAVMRLNAPASDEAEMSVLGAILQDQEAFQTCATILRPADFWKAAHEHIFAAALDVAHERGEPVDLTTVTNELRRRAELKEIGGHSYLCALIEAVPTTATVATHAAIVREKAIARRAVALGEELASVASADGDWRSVVDRLGHFASEEQLAFRAGHTIKPRPIAEVLDEIVASMTSGRPQFVKSPFSSLNALLCGGLAPGELVYVGARPGVGKTAFGLEFARTAAKAGTAVMVISREMVETALGRRMLSQEGRVPASLLRQGVLGEDEIKNVMLAVQKLRDLPIWMTAQALTITQIAGVVDATHPGLVLVDYLQLVRARAEDRRLEVEAVSQGLKALAMKHRIPVVCLSSLARPTSGSDSRPTMASLRESGALEHDADFVLLLHRKIGDDACEAQVAKARDGATGTVHLRFRSAYVTFEEADDRNVAE